MKLQNNKYIKEKMMVQFHVIRIYPTEISQSNRQETKYPGKKFTEG